MKLRLHASKISQSAPFEGCKLDRKQFADVLTQIVGTYSDGFVLSINNEWGTGKTTFVRMWQQQLINEGFKTVYFNAWENDFDSSPLTALMSELKLVSDSKSNKVFKSVIKKGALLAKNTLPVVVKSLAKKYVGDITEIATDVIEKITKTATEIFEERIKEYTTKKKTILEFRTELEKFIRTMDMSIPLVFIIDELDRCRPPYAVEVLEQLKHFFSVPGIVFVLSIDKSHLASSVKGVYGSDSINTDEYLRRFIDLEYSIPKPSTRKFCEYLFEYYSFSDFFHSEERRKIPEFQQDGSTLLIIAELLFSHSNATLRQQEKIFGNTRLVLNLFKSNQYVFSHILFLLIYLKAMKSDVYQKIDSNKFSLQELSDAFFDFTSSDEIIRSDLNLVYMEALLLNFYNNNKEVRFRDRLYVKDANGNLSATISSKSETAGSRRLADCFHDIHRQANYNETPLNYLLNKVNLTQSFSYRPSS